ncbi:GGDEF domain-containing protein [Ruegeria pomeroyi]|uniref:GGDEF domain-containing protein n=1 Tax=Ruegeria pomeroyi TaxID=89184 RepID=UPI0031F37187
MRINTYRRKWVAVALVTLISVVASVVVTGVVSGGLSAEALRPAIIVPLLVAPLATHWGAARLLEIDKLNQQLAHLNRIDQMTQLYNRACLLDELEQKPEEVGMILIADIDHFKQINDTYGHDVGDLVIVEVARILQRSSLPEGIAARFGGEEFVIYVPRLDLEAAEFRAEAIRQAVEAQSVRIDGRKLSCTISIGIEIKRQREDVGDVLKRADQALYRAKAQGRNRVVAARQPASAEIARSAARARDTS